MTKKEDHNIPKDFDKTVVHNNPIADKSEMIVGSTKRGMRSKLPHLRVNRKKVGIVFGVIALVVGISFASILAYNALNPKDIATQIVEEEAQVKEEYASEYDGLKANLAGLTGEERNEMLSYLTVIAKRLEKYDDALLYAVELDNNLQTEMTATVVGDIYVLQNRLDDANKYYDIAISRTDGVSGGELPNPYDDLVAKKQALIGSGQNAQ